MKLKILSDEPAQTFEQLEQILLKNRQIGKIQTEKSFLHPPSPLKLDYKDVGLNEEEMRKAINLIKNNLENNNQIVIYSDYDADGVCAGAILWQALHLVGARVTPFIPSREEDGYGLSISGINKILKMFPGEKPLLITVDNGIVAYEAAVYAKEHKLNLIITDHHVKAEKKILCDALIHTTQLCGAGVAWFLARRILKKFKKKKEIPEYENTFDILTIATVADMVPLVNFNRQIVKFGLEKLRATSRPGLLALFEEAGIDKEKIDSYEIGFIIGPRLNATGRISDSALNSLRILCVQNPEKARALAQELESVNRERQNLTFSQTELAIFSLQQKYTDLTKTKIILTIDTSYNQGVIGLIAGRLTEKFNRPAIVISQGEKISKASARSIAEFNIINALRKLENILINCGGHPMAAGFTIDTDKIFDFQEKIEQIVEEELSQSSLEKKISIDCEISAELLNEKMFDLLKNFSPFGMGNWQPVFILKACEIQSLRFFGNQNQHIKIFFKKNDKIFDAVGFNSAQKFAGLTNGQKIDLVFSVAENDVKNKSYLQLKVREIMIY